MAAYKAESGHVTSSITIYYQLGREVSPIVALNAHDVNEQM